MLPNHPPLVIAEQFGTLASLYPGRIDLGLGRASGAADNIVPALRLRPGARDHFPADVQELQGFFREPLPGQGPRAVPGAGLDVPIWLLGSSTHSAEQAAAFGLSYAFARYIAPDKVDAAIAIYRSNFRPSEGLDRAHVMIGVFIVAAETDEVARYLFTSTQQAVLEMRRGEVGPLRPPIQNLDAIASPEEMTYLDGTLRSAIVGSRETVRRGIEALISETEADELIVLALIHDQDARRRSFAIIAEARDAIAAKTRASYR
jgi:luciferase family oxidoreductase group 1